MSVVAIRVEDLSHRYGDRVALDRISFSVEERSICGFLGPNGGGKTTLFSLLSTLMPVQSGAVTALGFDLSKDSGAFRQQIGVTFQAPSLDRRLTVRENLIHQGHLYGLSGEELRSTASGLLDRFGVADRSGETVETLSGGLKRRVELAKCLLHRPRLLLLDEPSSGLDPTARHELWTYLEQLRADQDVTIVVATHLMEEAERCDRLALLDEGGIVAQGSPSELRSTVPGECVTIVAEEPEAVQQRIREELQLEMQRTGETLRLRTSESQAVFARLRERFGDEAHSIAIGKPTLEDVFLEKTGRRIDE